jgi:hypothetical protein
MPSANCAPSHLPPAVTKGLEVLVSRLPVLPIEALFLKLFKYRAGRAELPVGYSPTLTRFGAG